MEDDTREAPQERNALWTRPDFHPLPPNVLDLAIVDIHAMSCVYGLF